MKRTVIFAVLVLGLQVACARKEPVVSVSVALSDDAEVVVDRAYKLAKAKNYGLALDYLDRAAADLGEDPGLLECMNDVAVWMQLHERALDSALRLEAASTRKSPWNLLKIAEALLKLERADEALVYIERSVNERAFKRFKVFELAVYDPLRENPRFQRCITDAQASIGIGQPIHDLAVKTLDGDTVELRALGGRVVLIDFWASWCAPCIRELPHLQEIYSAHAAEGFEIVGISLDSDAELAADYVAEKEISWPTAHAPDGWQGGIVTSYGVNALPSTWLYDRKGVLRYYNVHGDDLGRAVEELLAEGG